MSQESLSTEQRQTIKVSETGRLELVTTASSESTVRIIAHYSSRLNEVASPQRMLDECVIQQLPPALLSELLPHQIAWTYNKQLKPVVMNARQILTTPCQTDQLADLLTRQECGCQHYDTKYTLPIQNALVQQHYPDIIGCSHVLTTDVSIVSNVALRNLLSQGLNHIPQCAADVNEVIDTNMEVMLQFCEQVLEPAAASSNIQLQDGYKQILIENAMQWTQYQAQHMQAPSKDEFCQQTQAALHKLQAELLICEVDKAANTPCFVCPTYAQLLVQLRLSKTTDFERVSLQAPELYTSLKEQMVALNPALSDLIEGDRVPLLRVAYKSHKNDFRFLTNASGTVLSGLNGLAQQLTSCIMAGLKGALAELNHNIASWAGGAKTQTFVVVTNAQQVAVNMPPTIGSDLCADIAKCFENIPINADEADSLQAALKWGISKAFRHVNDSKGKPQVLAVSYKGSSITAKWQNQPGSKASANKVYLTAEQTFAILDMTVSSAYVSAGAKLYRQTKGIPMGADYSPDSCNLYFMMYEAAAVQRICRLTPSLDMKQKLLGEWLYYFRMMDDVRVLNAPQLSTYLTNPQGTGDSNSIGWIYPACVGLDVTADVQVAGHDSVQQSQYLDMLTKIYPNGSYTVQVYDKHKKIPIKPIKLISINSNRSISNSYKLLLGQAARIAAISSTPKLAAEALLKELDTFTSRGFSRGRLLALLSTWASQGAEIPGKHFTRNDIVRQLYRINRHSR